MFPPWRGKRVGILRCSCPLCRVAFVRTHRYAPTSHTCRLHGLRSCPLTVTRLFPIAVPSILLSSARLDDTYLRYVSTHTARTEGSREWVLGEDLSAAFAAETQAACTGRPDGADAKGHDSLDCVGGAGKA